MLRFSLFILFVVVVVAVQFGDCENSADCDNITSAPGSDETRLSKLEEIMQGLQERFGRARKFIDKILGRESSSGTSFGEVFENFSNEIHAIFPGTLWCGSGDIAKQETDLGRFNRTDACCRAHDNCKNNLLAGESEVNLKNNGIFTRSACDCDFAFYDCLKNADSFVSCNIGKTYFNILQPQCFQCECPTPECNPTDGTECKDHCKKYKWVDSREF